MLNAIPFSMLVHPDCRGSKYLSIISSKKIHNHDFSLIVVGFYLRKPGCFLLLLFSNNAGACSVELGIHISCLFLMIEMELTTIEKEVKTYL